MKKMSLFLITFIATSFALSIGFAAGGEGHGGGGAHRDNTSLFPQPQADLGKGTAPGSAKLLEPAFNSTISTDSVTLKWATVESADHYHVQIATDPNFKWLKAEDHNIKGSEFTVNGLEKGKHYYWRVAAWKNGNMAATNKGRFSSSVFETK